MKKVLFTTILFVLVLGVKAQNYNASNTISRVALVYYYEDENGFFHKKENVSLREVFSVVSSYGYNKKSHELYVETDRANCIITVNDDLHKLLKKSKSIPQLKPEELTAKANRISLELSERFTRMNVARQKHIEDSIEQARKDSLRKVREDSLRIVAEKSKESSYRNMHRWFAVPSQKNSLYCDYCEKSIQTNDSILCYGLKNDTLFWRERKEGRLCLYYEHIHAAKVSNTLKIDKDFQYHCKVYKDSLETKIPSLNVGVAEALNMSHYFDYMDELKKEAPNGFFVDWGWDSEYSSIEFHFKYMNTNKNTIKYIEVFFVVTNDVGDVRKTGSFRGTGPLKEWESASWNWDHSSYYVAGDASNMNISKVIITYMNGTKVTIPKNKLRFD